MSLRAGRVGVNPADVDPINGHINPESVDSYTKAQADSKFATIENAQPKRLAVPINMLIGSQLTPITKVEDVIQTMNNAKTNGELTDIVTIKNVTYEFVDGSVTIHATNKNVKKVGGDLSFYLDFTMGENDYTAWSNFILLSETPDVNCPVFISIYNITDSQYLMTGGQINTSGYLAVGLQLLAHKRYAISFNTILT